MRIGLASVAMGILLLSTGANAAVVCQKANKKGVVKKIALRSECLKKETALTSGDLPASGPLVKDANGAEVGALVWNDFVIRIQDGRTLLINVRKDGLDKTLIGSDFANFFYLTPDCSGQPYFYGSPPLEGQQDALANGVVRPVQVSETGTKGYFVEDGALVHDAAVTKIYGGYVASSNTGAATCFGGDTAVGSSQACDSKSFCGSDPTTLMAYPSCQCINCCSLNSAAGKYVLIPVKTVDFPAFVAPFTVER